MKKINECVEIANFYYVEGHSSIGISKTGIVVNLSSGKLIRASNRAGYLYINLKNNKGDLAVHRLMAETFLAVPEIESKSRLFVNHLNGIKSDNQLTNLEWCTPKENSLHAYETGLRSDNIPVLCKDLRTNEITRFYSIWECAREFNINGAHIHYYLRDENYGKVRQKYFVFIKEGQNWPDLTKRDIGSSQNGDSKEIVLLRKGDNCAYLFKSISSLAFELKMKTPTLTKKLRSSVSKGERTLVILDYEITLRQNYKQDESVNLVKMNRFEKAKGLRMPRKPFKIEVTDLLTNMKKQFQSIANLASSLGVSKNTLQKHIYLNNGVWHNKLHVKYLR